MAGPYVVDASVFLNAFNPREPGHEVSRRLLARLQAEAVPIIAPSLLLPEVAGAVGRGTRDSRLARQFATAVSRLPHLVLVPLDTPAAQRAAEAAARFRLRGSDAVYATVAQQFSAALITLDREQRERTRKVVATRLPGEV